MCLILFEFLLHQVRGRQRDLLLFGNVTGVAYFFADVTSSTFDNVTTIASKIFFDDVTANLLVQMFQMFSKDCMKRYVF